MCYLYEAFCVFSASGISVHGVGRLSFVSFTLLMKFMLLLSKTKL